MSDSGSRNRRVRASALLVTSVLLISSATLRIGVQAQTSAARDLPESVANRAVPDPAPAAVSPDKASGQEAPGKPMTVAMQPVPAAADLQHLVSALRNREQQLNRRSMQIEDRMKALEIADAAIDRKLAALVQAEERLSATLALADGASEGDLTRLTDVYEKMKPKDAAALFEEMAPEFAAGFLGRMRPASAASIMTGLSPKTAYTISVILAGRNAWVPKE